jgi:glycosyltransferase involved in cell wall biosynthesis
MYVVPDLGLGGAERHVTTLMPNLNPARFEPAVVCVGAEGDLFADLGDVKAVALHRTKRQAIGALRDLTREMRVFRPDVVLLRGYNAELLGRVAARLAGVPHCVVWVHNHYDTEPRGAVRSIADRVLDRGTTAYFGVAEAQTEYLTKELGHPADKIRIIHNGVEPAAYRCDDDRRAVAELGIGDGDPVVGIVAALRPEKDHATLLRAARTVVDVVPEAKFLIVGDGPMRHEIESLRDELGLGDSVVMAGARHDVPDLLRAMNVVVLSSFAIECFPMALLEAMAAGRPAVCTDVGGVREMIDEGVTGYVVEPRDPGALARRLLDVLTDDALASRMGRAARARVEESFSLRASVANTEAVLDELTAVRPVRLAVVMDLTYVGGAEVLLLELFRRFDPRAVLPRLICLREAGPLADDFRAAGLDVEVLHRTGRFDLRTLPRLVRSLRRNGTDVVLVNHHHRAALALGRIAACLTRSANVVAAHDMDLASVGGRVLPRWTVDTLAFADALILLSESQRDYLHRREGVGRSRLATTREAVIANGIAMPEVPTAANRSSARLAVGASEGDFVVGIVARLSAQKAHDVLFAAVAKAACEVPRIRLVVIGGGERESELRSLAEDFGIGERTRFLGIRRDVAELLPGLDVACLSSVHEGVPITLIEAMAAGLPVVATDCGAVRDLVVDGETGFVVPVGDADQLAARLVRLAGDDALRTRLGTHGRRRAEQNHEIGRTAAAYEDLLQRVMRGKR